MGGRVHIQPVKPVKRPTPLPQDLRTPGGKPMPF